MISRATTSWYVRLQARWQLSVHATAHTVGHGVTSLGSSGALGCCPGRQPCSRALLGTQTPRGGNAPPPSLCHVSFLAPRLCCAAGECEAGPYTQVACRLLEPQQVCRSAMVSRSEGGVKLHSNSLCCRKTPLFPHN